MNRSEVIQALLNHRRAPIYLEIGVETGFVLLNLEAGRKIAVDPAFKIPWQNKVSAYLRHHSNRTISYFQLPSDDFFAHHNAALQGGVDVAFVDGLHTHEQAHRDVINCLKFLKPGGVIIMHDCLPPHAAAATPGNSPQAAEAISCPGWTGEWTGDVYKSVMQLRAEQPDLHVFVLDCDYGLGVIHRGTPEGSLRMSREEIAGLSYEDFANRQTEYLNLKPADYFRQWLSKQPPAQ